MVGVPQHCVCCMFLSVFVSYGVRLTNKYLKFIQARLEKFKRCWIWSGGKYAGMTEVSCFKMDTEAAES